MPDNVIPFILEPDKSSGPAIRKVIQGALNNLQSSINPNQIRNSAEKAFATPLTVPLDITKSMAQIRRILQTNTFPIKLSFTTKEAEKGINLLEGFKEKFAEAGKAKDAFAANVNKKFPEILNRVKAVNAELLELRKNLSALRTVSGKIDTPTGSTTGSSANKRPAKQSTEIAQDLKKQSKALTDVVGATSAYSSATARASAETLKFGDRIALTTTRLAAYFIPAFGIYRLAQGFRIGAEAVLEIDKNINRLTQIMDNNRQAASTATAQILAFGTAYGQSGRAILNILDTLAQAGSQFKGEELIKVAEAIGKTNLAATFGEIGDTTEGVIAILNQFSLSAADVNKVLDVTNKLSKDFAVESGDIFKAVQSGGGAFALAGGNIEEFAATVSTLRSLTRQSAQQIGTSLNSISVRLLRPETLQFIESLGANIRDSAGNLKGVKDIFLGIADATKGFNAEQLSAVIEKITGLRYARFGIPLIRDIQKGLGSEFIKTLDTAGDSTGSFSRDVITGLDRLDVQLQRITTRFEEVFKTISENTSFRQLIKDVAGIASVFASVLETVSPLLPILTKIAAIRLVIGIGKFGLNQLSRNTAFSRGPNNRPLGGGGGGGGGGRNNPTLPLTGFFGGSIARRSSAQPSTGRYSLSNLAKLNNQSVINSAANIGSVRTLSSSVTNPKVNRVSPSTNGLRIPIPGGVAIPLPVTSNPKTKFSRSDLEKYIQTEKSLQLGTPIRGNLPPIKRTIDPLSRINAPRDINQLIGKSGPNITPTDATFQTINRRGPRQAYQNNSKLTNSIPGVSYGSLQEAQRDAQSTLLSPGTGNRPSRDPGVIRAGIIPLVKRQSQRKIVDASGIIQGRDFLAANAKLVEPLSKIKGKLDFYNNTLKSVTDRLKKQGQSAEQVTTTTNGLRKKIDELKSKYQNALLDRGPGSRPPRDGSPGSGPPGRSSRQGLTGPGRYNRLKRRGRQFVSRNAGGLALTAGAIGLDLINQQIPGREDILGIDGGARNDIRGVLARNERNSVLSSTLSGLSTGAITGGMFGGVPGLIAGGVIGGVGGFFSGRSSAQSQSLRDIALASGSGSIDQRASGLRLLSQQINASKIGADEFRKSGRTSRLNKFGKFATFGLVNNASDNAIAGLGLFNTGKDSATKFSLEERVFLAQQRGIQKSLEGEEGAALQNSVLGDIKRIGIANKGDNIRSSFIDEKSRLGVDKQFAAQLFDEVTKRNIAATADIVKNIKNNVEKFDNAIRGGVTSFLSFVDKFNDVTDNLNRSTLSRNVDSSFRTGLLQNTLGNSQGFNIPENVGELLVANLNDSIAKSVGRKDILSGLSPLVGQGIIGQQESEVLADFGNVQKLLTNVNDRVLNTNLGSQLFDQESKEVFSSQFQQFVGGLFQGIDVKTEEGKQLLDFVRQNLTNTDPAQFFQNKEGFANTIFGANAGIKEDFIKRTEAKFNALRQSIEESKQALQVYADLQQKNNQFQFGRTNNTISKLGLASQFGLITNEDRLAGVSAAIGRNPNIGNAANNIQLSGARLIAAQENRSRFSNNILERNEAENNLTKAQLDYNDAVNDGQKAIEFLTLKAELAGKELDRINAGRAGLANTSAEDRIRQRFNLERSRVAFGPLAETLDKFGVKQGSDYNRLSKDQQDQLTNQVGGFINSPFANEILDFGAYGNFKDPAFKGITPNALKDIVDQVRGGALAQQAGLDPNGEGRKAQTNQLDALNQISKIGDSQLSTLENINKSIFALTIALANGNPELTKQINDFIQKSGTFGSTNEDLQRQSNKFLGINQNPITPRSGNQGSDLPGLTQAINNLNQSLGQSQNKVGESVSKLETTIKELESKGIKLSFDGKVVIDGLKDNGKDFAIQQIVVNIMENFVKQLEGSSDAGEKELANKLKNAIKQIQGGNK